MLILVHVGMYRSFGVLLWEIVSYGKPPLGDSSVEDIIDAAQKGDLRHARYANIVYSYS